MTEFKKITTPQPVEDALFETIYSKLHDGKKVLWLMPGGSSIPIAQKVLTRLAETDCSNLAISLTDERYGDVGHSDENWHAIMNTIASPKGARYVSINYGDTFEKTVAHYGQELKELFDWADVSVGFFGIGPDGHTAGMLPHSPAVDSVDFAAGYPAGPFMRITMTPPAVQRLTYAFAYARGQEKKPILEALQSDKDIHDMPSQILKTVPTCVIFNDAVGEPA